MSESFVQSSPLAAESPEQLLDKPPREQLGKRTLHGSLWTVGSYIATYAVRFASNLILTRMLAPSLFGVMLIVNTVMTGIRLFSDVGIGPALIANPNGEAEPFLRTAYTTQIIRGVGIWIVSLAVAIPVGHYYARTDPTFGVLSQLLPVAGFVAIIEGLRSTAIFRLQRQLRLAELAGLDIIEIVVTAIGMITWAWLATKHFSLPDDKAIWALVVPPLFGSAAAMIASHRLMNDRRDRFGWDKPSAAAMMQIGRWIFVSTMLSFLASQVDRLIFGKLADATMSGVYNIAVTLAMMPTMGVMKVGQAVLFPTFARVADDPARFANVYRRARTMLLTIAAMIVAGMIATGPFAVGALYKTDFAAAGWMLQLLAIGVWFQVVDTTNIAALLARQHPNWMAGANLTKVVFMFAMVPLAYHLGYGLGGILIALGIADLLRSIASTFGIAQLGLAKRTLWPDMVFPAAIAATGLAGLELARTLKPHVDTMFGGGPKMHRFVTNGTLAATAGVLVLVIWVPVCMWQWKLARRATP